MKLNIQDNNLVKFLQIKYLVYSLILHYKLSIVQSSVEIFHIKSQKKHCNFKNHNLLLFCDITTTLILLGNNWLS